MTTTLIDQVSAETFLHDASSDNPNCGKSDATKMDSTIRETWLRDLRSGQFMQCQSHLRDFDGKMCCLGVLANQFDPEWVSGDQVRYVPVLNGEILSEGGLGERELSGKLSPTFLASVGIPDSKATTLMRMNDMCDSFTDIADYIEEKL